MLELCGKEGSEGLVAELNERTKKQRNKLAKRRIYYIA